MLKLDALAMGDAAEFQPAGLCSISGSGGKSESSSSSKTVYNKKFLDPFYTDFPLPIYSNDVDGVQVTNLNPTRNMRVIRDEDGNPVLDQNGNPQMEEAPLKGQNKNNGAINAPGFNRQQFLIGLPKFQGLEDMDFNKLQTNLYDRQKMNLEPDYNKMRGRIREELSQSGLLNSGVAYGEGGALDILDRDYLDQLQKSASDAAIQTVGLKKEEIARKLGFDFDIVSMIESILKQRADVALRAGGKSQSSGDQVSGSGGIFQFGGSNSSGTK